jgi:hypothetical protein
MLRRDVASVGLGARDRGGHRGVGHIPPRRLVGGRVPILVRFLRDREGMQQPLVEQRRVGAELAAVRIDEGGPRSLDPVGDRLRGLGRAPCDDPTDVVDRRGHRRDVTSRRVEP